MSAESRADHLPPPPEELTPIEEFNSNELLLNLSYWRQADTQDADHRRWTFERPRNLTSDNIQHVLIARRSVGGTSPRLEDKYSILVENHEKMNLSPTRSFATHGGKPVWPGHLEVRGLIGYKVDRGMGFTIFTNGKQTMVFSGRDYTIEVFDSEGKLIGVDHI